MTGCIPYLINATKKKYIINFIKKIINMTIPIVQFKKDLKSGIIKCPDYNGQPIEITKVSAPKPFVYFFVFKNDGGIDNLDQLIEHVRNWALKTMEDYNGVDRYFDVIHESQIIDGFVRRDNLHFPFKMEE